MNNALEVHFDLLVQSLRGYHDGFIDGSFKATGFVLLVLGWLLTSREARAYLGGSRRARRLAVLGLSIGALVYAILSWRAYVLSQSVHAQLVALDYVPATAFADLRISAAALVVFVAQNAILTGLTCHLMLGMRSADVTSKAVAA